MTRMTSKNLPHIEPRRWLALFVVGWSFVATGWSAEPVSKEYQLKAAFLYNFTKFVEWPTNRFATPDEPFVIGVLGNNPFSAELAKAVQGRVHNGRMFVVTNLASATIATNVHVLFVSKGAESTLAGHGHTIHRAAVLTVGESEAFVQAGGIINFTTETDKIRFSINQAIAEQTDLKISSKLLQLANTGRAAAPPRTP